MTPINIHIQQVLRIFANFKCFLFSVVRVCCAEKHGLALIIASKLDSHSGRKLQEKHQNFLNRIFCFSSFPAGNQAKHETSWHNFRCIGKIFGYWMGLGD